MRYLDSLNLKLDISMLGSAVEFRVPVDVIHRGDVVSDQRQYFFPRLLRVVMQLRRQTQIQYPWQQFNILSDFDPRAA